MSTEKPWWFPQLTDDAWIARIRAEYPEDMDGLDDEAVRDGYADGMKYADTWDHLGDARHSYEHLADAYLALLAANDSDAAGGHGDWQLVPKVPTEAMVEADLALDIWATPADSWAAMLSAAPSPQEAK